MSLHFMVPGIWTSVNWIFQR